METEPSADVLKRMEKIALALDLRPDDAVWSICLGLEFYDRVFESRLSHLEKIFETFQNKTPLQGWFWIALSLSGAVILGAICFIGGFLAASGQAPAWMVPGHIFYSILNAPAGWILALGIAPWPICYLFGEVKQRINNRSPGGNLLLAPVNKTDKQKTVKLVLSASALILAAGIVLSLIL